MHEPFERIPDIDDVHWDRETYRQAQELYAQFKRQIAALQSLNATLYRRIRAARRNYQLDQQRADADSAREEEACPN